MQLDVIQHIIDVSNPWFYPIYNRINKNWNMLINIAIKRYKYADAIKNCNILAISVERRKFSLGLILANACELGYPEYRNIISHMYKLNIHEWNPAIAAACRAGQLEIVKYLINRFSKYNWLRYNWLKQEHFKIDMHAAIINACLGCDVRTLKFCLKSRQLMLKKSSYYRYPALLNIGWHEAWFSACESGSLDIMELIRPYISNRIVIYGLYGAYKGGHTELISMFEKLGYVSDIECLKYALISGNRAALNYASRIGEAVEIDEQLIPNNVFDFVKDMPNVKMSTLSMGERFLLACRAGELDKVIIYSGSVDRQLGLINACINGRREVMNYFINLGIHCTCGKSHKQHIRYINYHRHNWH